MVAAMKTSATSLGVGLLAVAVFWTVMIFDALCYGEGWCRYANDEVVTDAYGNTYHEPGDQGQMFNFRFGGWDQ